jgi:hypothetical protein
MSRLTRITTLFIAATAAVLMPATAAMAYVQPPQPGLAGSGQTIPAVSIVTQSMHSGLATWAVLVIAIGAVMVGAALAEGVRRFSRRHGRKLATA